MRRVDWMALLLAALGLLIALPVLTYPLGRDQGMYANIAQAIRSGGLPFIDMWDIKPPAIYYIYAGGITLFGASATALRAIDFVAAPFTLFALYHLTERFAGRGAARWAMLLFPVFYFTETFASLTQSDSLVTLPMTWAALFALLAIQGKPAARRTLLWAALSGFACAVVILFKHYYVLFMLALVGAHLWERLRGPMREIRALIYEAVAFSAGGLLFGIPVIIYFVTTGILDEMLVVAQGTSQYNMDALQSLSAFWAQMENYVYYRWWHWGPLLILAALNVIPAVRRKTPGFPSALVYLWLIDCLAFVVIQAKGFDTHWIPLLPPLVMLGARTLDRLVDAAPPRRYLRPALPAVALALFAGILAKDTWVRAWPYLTGAESQHTYFRHFQAGDLNAADSLFMAEWLQARTVTGESVYIWGFRPEIAFMAGLRPATRFQAQFPLVGERYPQVWKQENVDALWAAMPEYVIIMRADNMPWVTGSLKDSNQLVAEDYQHLRDWLIENYERGPELGNFLTWRHKAAPPEQES